MSRVWITLKRIPTQNLGLNVKTNPRCKKMTKCDNCPNKAEYTIYENGKEKHLCEGCFKKIS